MTHCRSLPRLGASLAAALLLAACGAPGPKTGDTGKQAFRVEFAGGASVDYVVERKLSQVNNRSCYTFITGTLRNDGTRTLGRRTVIDFTAIAGGKPLFRDITNPLGEIQPGAGKAFKVVDGPVHRDGCPDYERIDVQLRPVYLD